MLSTCNRTELYLAREDDAEDVAVATLTELAGDRAAELAGVLYRLRDEAAALHLFRVAAGLDSLVPGEGEILGQVRAAYEGGATGPFLDRLCRQALHVGRRVRIETAIAESPASVPAAGAALAQQVFEELDGKRVLLVGAGKMSELTARNLVSRGATIGAVANRTLEHAQELAGRLRARATDLAGIGLELAERGRRRRLDERAGNGRDEGRRRRRAPGAQGPAAPARRPRRPARPRSRHQRARGLLPLRRGRPRGRRRRDDVRPAERGGARREARRGRGGALPGVAGLARGRAHDRVPARARGGDPRRRARAGRFAPLRATSGATSSR